MKRGLITEKNIPTVTARWESVIALTDILRVGGSRRPRVLLKSGKRTQRVSWICALKDGHLFAPMTFEGSCNRDLFEMWLEQSLLPQLQAGDVIVIDNASFHNAQSIEELVAEQVANFGLFHLTPLISI
jgi:hypothetical protein